MAKSGSTYKMVISTSNLMFIHSTNEALLNLNTEKLYRVMIANKCYDF